MKKELQKESKKIEETVYLSLIDQVRAEYDFAYRFMQSRFSEWGTRLKIYNNQTRDKDSYGDPLMFTIHQTVLAALYDDRLMMKFLKVEEGDRLTAENLNAMAKYDYDLMQKDVLDYEYDFNATFFGRAIMLMLTFNREMMVPVPEVMDPMVTLRDPMARTLNGDLIGRGAARFFGREIRLSKYDIEKSKGVLRMPTRTKVDDISQKNLFDQAQNIRTTNQGLNSQPNKDVGYKQGSDEKMSDNQTFLCLEWFTHYQGKKVFVTLASDKKEVIRFVNLEESFQTTRWPGVDRSIYPVANNWDGVSIPDLLEDKQRMRAVLQNLLVKGIRSGLYPQLAFDVNKIKSVKDLDFGFNKLVKVNGDVAGAIQPIRRDIVAGASQWILDYIDVSAQKATATPDIQQGVLSADKRTATELNIAQQKVDTRYSLCAKIFGWSERRFWEQWYRQYKVHFKQGIDKKVVRITGAFGQRMKKMTRENVIMAVDPDITVESRVLAEAKKRNRLQVISNLMTMIGQDPYANKRYAEKILAEESGLEPYEIELLLPATPEELLAQKENDAINQGKNVPVKPTDDDLVHIMEHLKADENEAQRKHIEAHRMAIVAKKQRPELFAAQQGATVPGDQMMAEQPASMPSVSYSGAGPSNPLPPNA